jgi:hypothetical protein
VLSREWRSKSRDAKQRATTFKASPFSLLKQTK